VEPGGELAVEVQVAPGRFGPGVAGGEFAARGLPGGVGLGEGAGEGGGQLRWGGGETRGGAEDLAQDGEFADDEVRSGDRRVPLAQAAGDEAKAAFRAQADRMVAEMDLIRRDDFDALKAEVAALRAEVEALRAAGPKPAPSKADKAPRGAAKAPKSGGPKTGGGA